MVYFEVFKRGIGQYWWRIRSGGNHEVLVHSEILASKASCLHAIALVKASAGSGQTYDQTGE